MKIIFRLKSRLRTFCSRLHQRFFTREKLVLLAAFAFCASWTWGAINSMSRNWELEQRLHSLRREMALLQIETEALELENQYYQSEEYQELAARQKLNRKFPDETLVYLPPNTTHSSHKPSANDHTPTPSNFQQWLSFLFGFNQR